MHLLDAWTSLALPEFVRLIGIPAAVLLATLLPGRRVARSSALAVAVAVTLLVEIESPFGVRAGWMLLWALVAWQAGATGHGESRVRTRRRGAIEAGAVALPLGVGLVLLLLAAESRQALGATDARRASLGALVVGAGLLHLMMRRHTRRALVALAALGLGLELLAASARMADVTRQGAPPGAALAGTLVAVALAHRIGGARERHAGSVLVSDAHDLHD